MDVKDTLGEQAQRRLLAMLPVAAPSTTAQQPPDVRFGHLQWDPCDCRVVGASVRKSGELCFVNVCKVSQCDCTVCLKARARALPTWGRRVGERQLPCSWRVSEQRLL